MANGFRTPRAYPRGETVNIDTGSLEQDLYKVSLATGIIDARAFGGTEDINIGPTKEQMITAAIQYAAGVGASAVFVAKSMRPYTASLVTFNTSILMVDESLDLSRINIQSYGARGDGVTDDSVAIQAAIEAIRIAGGGTVWFPNLIFGIGTTLKIGDAGVVANGITLKAVRSARATAGATLKWIGAIGGDNAILSIRNAHMGAIEFIGFDGNNKADYCVQIRHVTGDVNVTEHWDHHQCMYTAAGKYNVLIGEVDTTALSTGDASEQNFHNCYFRRDALGLAATTAHIRVRSANTLPVNFFGCQTDHSTFPTNGISTDGGVINVYGHVSVGTDNIDILIATQATQVPPSISVFGWESQSTNFMRADVTGAATVQRSTLLCNVKHGAIAGTPGDAIQWTQSSGIGGHGGLILVGGRFDKAVNIINATSRVWAFGPIFTDSTQAFTGHPEVVAGDWGTNLGFNHQVPAGAVAQYSQNNGVNQFTPKTIQVANNGIAALGSGTMLGMLFVSDSEGGVAQYVLRGSAHNTNEVSDVLGVYSNAAGIGASNNIYWSAGNTRYEIENKRGLTQNYSFNFFGVAG